MNTAAQSPSPTATPASHHAKGTFEVTVKPVPLADPDADKMLARLTLDKQFSGDLTGTGKGEMLAAGNPASGAGGYVAIEQVNGTLNGRKGSFVFQHRGTMNGSQIELDVTVVPGSGTGELTGIAGTFKIDIVEGKHFYDFAYTVPQ